MILSSLFYLYFFAANAINRQKRACQLQAILALQMQNVRLQSANVCLQSLNVTLHLANVCLQSANVTLHLSNVTLHLVNATLHLPIALS